MPRPSLHSWFHTAKLLLLRQQLYALTIILTLGLLQLSDRVGVSLPFAAQLQIAPLNATVALLTVLLLTTLIVLACVRPLLSRPVVQTLRQ
ncbi:hypothetical protein MN202_08085 [Rheinheimera muenzenbergensis]|uniref:ABC transport system permease protein n=1 Tax=Rheinheimera muenzenbergensis TaxID=1193628 RepID=A0ABU8C5J1_9GAMM